MQREPAVLAKRRAAADDREFCERFRGAVDTPVVPKVTPTPTPVPKVTETIAEIVSEVVPEPIRTPAVGAAIAIAIILAGLATYFVLRRKYARDTAGEDFKADDFKLRLKL